MVGKGYAVVTRLLWICPLLVRTFLSYFLLNACVLLHESYVISPLSIDMQVTSAAAFEDIASLLSHSS